MSESIQQQLNRLEVLVNVQSAWIRSVSEILSHSFMHNKPTQLTIDLQKPEITREHEDQKFISHTPEYKVWVSLAFHHFKNTGNQRYDKAWESFENFKRDMGPKPQGTRFQVINRAKGYFPGNCIWKKEFHSINSK